MSESKAERARALRYKACDTIHWWTDQDDETLLNALDGDDEDVWEFKMAFAHLEARAYELFETIYELCRYEDDFGQVYDDCTVALIGNRYQTIGYDSFEEEEITLQEDGSFLVRVAYPVDDWFYGSILSYGVHAKVIDPPELRERIEEMLKKMLENYQREKET